MADPTVKTAIIADDHRIMREGLRSLLEKSGCFECIAEADDGYQAVKLAKELHPDIVIMDVAMPNMNGIEATRQIKTELPEIEVIVLSMHATQNYVSQVLQAGASAYLLKDSAFEELSTALLAISPWRYVPEPGNCQNGSSREPQGRLDGRRWEANPKSNEKRNAGFATDRGRKIHERYRRKTLAQC